MVVKNDVKLPFLKIERVQGEAKIWMSPFSTQTHGSFLYPNSDSNSLILKH